MRCHLLALCGLLYLLTCTPSTPIAGPAAAAEERPGSTRHAAEGAWRLIEDDGAPPPKGIEWIQHRTATHEITVAHDVERKLVVSTIVRRYTLKGDTYTTTCEFATVDYRAFIGKEDKLTLKVEGDKATLKGVLHNGIKLDQVFQRVK